MVQSGEDQPLNKLAEVAREGDGPVARDETFVLSGLRNRDDPGLPLQPRNRALDPGRFAGLAAVRLGLMQPLLGSLVHLGLPDLARDVGVHAVERLHLLAVGNQETAVLHGFAQPVVVVSTLRIPHDLRDIPQAVRLVEG